MELKRKADDAHDRTRSHGERCWRPTKDHMMAEEFLNNGLGCLGDLVKDTTGATRSLTCGGPDRESNDVSYLQEAINMIAELQRRGSRSRSTSQQMDTTLEERQPGQGTGRSVKHLFRPWVRRLGGERKQHFSSLSH